MKKIITCLSLIFLISGLYAQEEQDLKTFKQEFGMHAGFTTGVGLSYRFWPGKLGFQATLLPIKTDDFTFISAGLTALYSFHESKYFRFFGYLGNHIWISNDEYDFWTGEYDPVSKNKYNIGFGPGFSFGTRVRFNIMFGYALWDVMDKFNMYPSGEIGLYFRF